MRELREAYRSFRAAPSLFALAVASLGLAVGPAAAVFSVVDALLLAPLPVHEPNRLALLTEGPQATSLWVNRAGWEAVRDLELFEGVSAWSLERLATDLDHAPELDVVFASPDFFDVLGLSPAIGRFFDPSDVGENIVVLGHGYWASRYGSARDALGKTLTIGRESFTIVGVAPKPFYGLDVGRRVDVLAPLASEPAARGPASRLRSPFAKWLRIVGRPSPGQSFEELSARLRLARPRIREATLPDYASPRARRDYMREVWQASPAGTGTSGLRARYREPLFALAGVVVLLLVVACSNVANLLLARGARRRRELAVRTALGATRELLIRQTILEGALLAMAGGVLGLVLGHWVCRLLLAFMSTTLETIEMDVSPDGRLLAFAILLGLVTSTLVAALPAARAGRIRATDSFGDGLRSAAPPRPRLAGALIVGQIALSFVLLVGAGLFSLTFFEIAHRELGFEPERVLNVDVDLRPSGLDSAGRHAFLLDALRGVAELSDVRYVAASPAIPIGFREMTTSVELGGTVERVRKNVVSPDWFRALGTRVLAGRGFDERDHSGTPGVAMVNETFAMRFFGTRDVVGRSVVEMRASRSGVDERDRLKIVGLVEDVVYRSVHEPRPPTVYLPLAQAAGAWPFINVVLRPAPDVSPKMLSAGVSATLERLDAGVAFEIRPMNEQVEATYNHERVLAHVVGFVGALSLFLAALGLFGVTSHAVTVRRREIAIGIALGADRARVFRAVFTRVAALLFAGIGVGVVAALGASALLRSLLLDAPDALAPVYASAGSVLVLTALLATWVPARRAAGADPSGALRDE